MSKETITESQPEAIEESPEKIEERERAELDTYVADLNARIAVKQQLRQENLNCVRPQDEFFYKLDSSLKKNTAFVKKLKQFTAAQLDSIMKDMSGLNLSKYISEISAALVEAKLKMTDVPAVITLCSKLHQTYADFSSTFFESWQKVLSIKAGDKIVNASKMRVDLRLFSELVSIGIFTNKMGFPLLGQTLTSLISPEKDDHSNLSILLSFCRHCGEEYAGLVPSHILKLAEKHKVQLPSSTLLTADKKVGLRNFLKTYYQSLSTHVRSEHKELQSALRTHKKILESKGEVPNDRREKLEMLQTNFDKLQTSALNLSDLLNEPFPELPKHIETSSGGIVLDTIDDSSDVQLDPWGDDETKSFYLDLPDLRQFLPDYAPKNVTPPPEENTMTEEALDMDIDPEPMDIGEAPLEEDAPKPGTPEPTVTEEPTVVSATSSTTNTSQNPLASKQYFEVVLQNLSNCVNKELIDSATIDFLLNLNTKNNRKKLARSLFNVQRTRLDLLPLYARMTATVSLVNTDIASELANLLKHDFRYHLAKKNQMNIESKIKVVRFIGELVKFGLYPKIEALFCMKTLLNDFQHHQIEMMCAFLEVAGQYLYNCKDTRLRTDVYLEQMLRIKKVTAMDSRHAAQVENAYYLVKPPESGKVIKIQRPPMHMYIRHLIFELLNKSNVDKVIKLMRRLNWDDPDIRDYAVKCLSKAYLVRYHLIRALADLVSGLSSYQDKAMVRVIDSVFEDIRAGLEIHSPKLAQRRIAMAKYLGELYNYKLIESYNILNTLYSIISLGVTHDYSVESEMDPPDSLFRLKLACVLLDTCGQYFSNGKRLDYFLVFFQHYYWFKKSHPDFIDKVDKTNLFPIIIDHLYKECLKNIRPKLKFYKSYDQAKEAVESLRLQLYPTLLTPITNQDGAGDMPEGAMASNSENPNLDTINEDTEMEETVNEFTEETSEAMDESDDDRGGPREECNDGGDDLRPITPTAEDAEQSKLPDKTQEDLDFEQAFDRLALDSIQERIRENVKPAKDIPVPMMARSGKKTYDQIQGLASSEATSQPEASVAFTLMVRGGKSGKQQFKTFAAPKDSALAVNLRLQEQKTREENERVKLLTLNITERIEEEDYQESLLQAQRPPSQNRNAKQGRQHKFKHQKGVPDADLIFS